MSRRVRQGQVTAEQDDMGAGLGAQVRLRDDDDIQRVRELLMEQLRLVQAGLDVPLHRGLFEVWHRDVVVIDLVAILAMGAPPGIGAGVGEVQRRITPELGNQVQVVLPRHLRGRCGCQSARPAPSRSTGPPRRSGAARRRAMPVMRNNSGVKGHVGFGVCSC